MFLLWFNVSPPFIIHHPLISLLFLVSLTLSLSIPRHKISSGLIPAFHPSLSLFNNVALFRRRQRPHWNIRSEVSPDFPLAHVSFKPLLNILYYWYLYMLHFNWNILPEAISITISMWGNIRIHVFRCSCGLKANVMKRNGAVNAPSSSRYPPVCPGRHCQALLLHVSHAALPLPQP